MPNKMERLLKLKNYHYDSAIAPLGIHPKEMKSVSKGYLHTHVHFRIIHSNHGEMT